MNCYQFETRNDKKQQNRKEKKEKMIIYKNIGIQKYIGIKKIK